jgi:hypothetical protein
MVVELGWRLELNFEGGLAWGCVREVHALGIKFEFNWKTKSHKIQRLEFVSDKIKGVDCKREVICIHFIYPMKKNKLVGGSLWEAAMAGLEASWEAVMGSSSERGRRGGMGRGAGLLGALGGGRAGRWGGASCSALRANVSSGAVLCYVVREEGEKKRGRKERRKEKEGKEKKKKIWKIFQTWNFPKNKR